jgi:surface polysaccharide O-acyltransferase-like enzyme
VAVANSTQIAGLLGPTLIAISLTESMNIDIFANTSAHLVYLNGTLLFVAGLAIVRVNNGWTGGWSVLVTLMGWLAILGGLIRMIAPVSAQQQTGQRTTAVYTLLIVLLAIGIFLTFKAYGREDNKTAVEAWK